METGRSISVLSIEDDFLIGLDITETIDEQPDMHCIGCLQSINQLHAEIEDKKPDILLLDLDTKGGNSLKILKDLIIQFPKMKIIIFSGYSDNEHKELALAGGAHEYIVKSGSMTPLIEAIRRVCIK